MMVVMIMRKFSIKVRWRSIFLIFFSWAILYGFHGRAIGDENHHSSWDGKDFYHSHSMDMNDRRSRADNHQRRNFSPEEQDRLRRNFQEWKSFSPEHQREFRHRMDQWRGFSPEERNLYQKRYHQFQQLPPDERGRVREKLNRWDNLSPQEQEEIRRTFPRH
jgi:hypothetical protein